jgi:hypothetical protein
LLFIGTSFGPARANDPAREGLHDGNAARAVPREEWFLHSCDPVTAAWRPLFSAVLLDPDDLADTAVPRRALRGRRVKSKPLGFHGVTIACPGPARAAREWPALLGLPLLRQVERAPGARWKKRGR